MNILNIIGISTAQAQTAVPSVNESTTATTVATPAAPAQHAGGGIMEMVAMLAIFMILFWFLLIRPQNKRAKELQNTLASLKKGDEVLTTAGIVGRVVDIGDDFITLNLSDNVNVTFQKQHIASLLPKGTLKNIKE